MSRLAPELAVMAEQVTARGVAGVVAAAAPQAAQAGIAALRDGGNAFDAAVAAALAETVLLPPKCGLGGDLVALVLTSDAPEPVALIAVGGAPAGLAAVADAGDWRDVGPMSVGPPAAAAGYAALAARGVLGRPRLAAPATALAIGGFAWAAVCSRLGEQAAALVREMNPDGTVFYPGGVPIAPGAATSLPGLAGALTEWAERGERFLEGPVGDAIVRAVHERGGVLATEDFEFATAEWRASATVDVAGRRAWATPAPTHGVGLLETISDFSRGERTAESLHSAVMTTIARQRESLGDPGTSMVSAADRDGNVVVVVHSNSYPRFGSGIIVDEFDLTLANRAGRGFTPRRGHPNFPTAGRRPATTLHAWAISDAGPDHRPRFLGGTPGGANQMPWNAQALARILRGEAEPGVLVASPLWEWLPDDEGLRVELGFAEGEAPAGAGRVVHAPRWGCKSAQQVVRIPSVPGETWAAAADPRTVGLALAL